MKISHRCDLSPSVNQQMCIKFKPLFEALICEYLKLKGNFFLSMYSNNIGDA